VLFGVPSLGPLVFRPDPAQVMAIGTERSGEWDEEGKVLFRLAAHGSYDGDAGMLMPRRDGAYLNRESRDSPLWA